jgi:mono/diheme cytochrome c family protein
MMKQQQVIKWLTGLRLIAEIPLIFALTVTTAMAQQQGLASPKPRRVVYSELTKAPDKAGARPNPLENDADAVPAGAKLFSLHCAQCHGEAAQGSHRAPSLLARPVRQATPGTLFWVLTNGVVRRGMPVWSKLPEPQRWQIVSYLKSLTPADKPPAR